MFNLFIIFFVFSLFIYILIQFSEITKDINTLYDNYSKILQESIERNIKGEK